MNSFKKSAKAKYLDKNSLNNGILSLVGALFHRISISAIWTINNIAPYLISYLLKYQERKSSTLSLSYGYFFFPILNTTLVSFMPLCGLIELKLGVQSAIIIGALINMLAYVILYISPTIYLDFFAVFLLGAGLSVSTALSTKNSVFYFFNKRGTISCLLEILGYLLTVLHNFIAEKMVNSGHEEIIKGSSFYTVELSEKILNYFLFEIGSFGVSTLLTLLFLVPYDIKAAQNLSKELREKTKGGDKENNAINEDENQRGDNEGNLIIEDYNTEQKYNFGQDNQERLLPPEEDKNENTGPNARYQVQDSANNDDYEAIKASLIEKSNKVLVIPNTQLTNLERNAGGQLSMSANILNFNIVQAKKALKSIRIWKLFILILCSNLGVNLLLITWRPIGINSSIPTKTLQHIGNLIFIFTCLGVFIFGFLSEKISFKIIFTIISTVTSFIGFTFPFCLHNEAAFMFLVLAMNFNLGGYIGALIPHYMKAFGMKHYVEIGGVIGLANVIMNPICAFFAFFVENNCKDKEFAYKIIFISGSSLNLISLILSAFETEDRLE